jgi:hypothetical protein
MSPEVWALYLVLISLPAVLYLLYNFRRKKTRIDNLLQTLQVLALQDTYMSSRHKEAYEQWRASPKREEEFRQIVNEDFRAGLRNLDFLVPVFIVTVLAAIGWGATLGFERNAVTLGGTTVEIPLPLVWGFLGAYFANLASLIEDYINYDLAPVEYHRMYQRLLFSTVAAFLLARAVGSAALVAFGVGLFPYQESWDIITKRAAAALGLKEKGGIPPEAALANVQGLEDPNVRQKLLDLNISTVQSLATQDPLELFFRTSFPLRTVVDWIDKAILYTYLGKKTLVLRERGIGGAIELGSLLELSEKLPVETTVEGKLKTEPLRMDLLQLDVQALYKEIAEALEIKYEELLSLIYAIYYDPMVDNLYDIWGRD